VIRACPPLAALLLALCCLFWPHEAQANVGCQITSMSINFGTSTSGTGSVGYSCTNYNATTADFTICSALGPPSYPGTTQQPKMINGANELNFNLYTNSARTTVWVATTILSAAVSIPAGQTKIGSLPFYGLIPGGQAAPAGAYTASFHNTSVGAIVSGACTISSQSILNGFSGQDGTLNVNATVGSNCTVSATPLAFGTVMANATNLSGTSTLTVTCPNGTPYYIGLAPSNNSTTGAGVMSGTGGNTDKPPYQLRSTAGSSGTIWGNTATSTSVGNGVGGTGTGSAQNRTVYATIPSANYRPDSYSDTVTVRVNY